MGIIKTERLQQFAIELVAIAAVSISLWLLFSAFIYPLLGIQASAPMPVRTVVVLVMVFVFIKRRKETFSEFGLKLTHPMWVVGALTIAFFGLKLVLVQPIADWIVGILSLPRADTGVFDHIQGNLTAYLGWLIVAVGVGGFAEEFIFRGFLLKRIYDVFTLRSVGITVAVILQAIIFGALHFYVGLAGVISATVSALVYGCFFVISGKSLIPLILTHALWDSLIFTLLFFSGGTST